MITKITVTGDEWQVAPGNGRRFNLWRRSPSPSERGGIVSRCLESTDGGMDRVGHCNTRERLGASPLPGERVRVRADVSAKQPPYLSPRATRHGFSLVEVLIVVSLLSLIVLALMAVFSSTQKAFRSAVTQTDVLEGGRAAVDLLASDLRTLVPSGGESNNFNGPIYPPVNFFAVDNNQSSALAYTPLLQSLSGSTAQRTNVLNYFFVLGRENTKWTGTGYAVNCTNTDALYSLYRFHAETNIQASPYGLFNAFITAVNFGQWTNMSRVVDGVVHLTVRAYDPNGYWMTNTYQFNGNAWSTNKNVTFFPPVWGEVGFYMFSNTVPAAVQLEIGVLEDRALARAESLPKNSPAQLNYLREQAGKVHLFRQRVTIPNVDPTAYQ